MLRIVLVRRRNDGRRVRWNPRGLSSSSSCPRDFVRVNGRLLTRREEPDSNARASSLAVGRGLGERSS